MNTTQKSTAPVQPQKANSGSLPQSQQSAPPPHLNTQDHEFCAIHRLEEALQLTASLHLTSDQTTKIAVVTKQQAERCAAAHQAHKASHDQILAILTPDQQTTLKSMSEHCASGGSGAAGGKVCHPAAV